MTWKGSTILPKPTFPLGIHHPPAAQNYGPPWVCSCPAWELHPIYLFALCSFHWTLLSLAHQNLIQPSNLRRWRTEPPVCLHNSCYMDSHTTYNATCHSQDDPQNCLDLSYDQTLCPTPRLVPRMRCIRVCCLGFVLPQKLDVRLKESKTTKPSFGYDQNALLIQGRSK